MNEREPLDSLLAQAAALDDAVAAPESCPDPEDLARFLEGGLAGADRRRMEAHLAGCARCRLVAALALEAETETGAEAPLPEAAAPAGPQAGPGPGLWERLRAWLSPPRVAVGFAALAVLALITFTLSPEQSSLLKDQRSVSVLKSESAPAREPRLSEAEPLPAPRPPAPGMLEAQKPRAARRYRAKSALQASQQQASRQEAARRSPPLNAPGYLMPLARSLAGVRPAAMPAPGSPAAGMLLADAVLDPTSPPGWGELVVGTYPLAVVAHGGVAAGGLDLTGLGRIYRGEVSRWEQLGTGSGPIRPLGLPPGSHAARLWRRLVLGQGAPAAGLTVAGGPGQMAAMVAGTPGALGYLPLTALPPGMRPLAVDGIAPTPEALAAGRYPLAGRVVLRFEAANRSIARRLLDTWRRELARRELRRAGLMVQRP